MRHQALTLYWDSSAVISVLFPDSHHEQAAEWAHRSAIHVISTLAWAEVHSVISRLQCEGGIAAALVDAARSAQERDPWTRLQDPPDWNILRALALRWPLPGADLWHLALAKTLQQERPELRLLSFDDRLSKAVAGEGLAATTST